MKHMIKHNPVYSTLHIQLNQGEQIIAEQGAMITMTPSIEVKAKTSGRGIGAAFKSMLGGESFFSTTFTAVENDSELILAPSTAGDILHFSLQDQTVYGNGGAYLAGSPGLQRDIQGSFRGAIMGEGLFLQKISGRGELWFSCYGAIFVKNLAAGESYAVDTGNMIAFEDTVTFTVKMVNKSLFSTLASGEGLVSNFAGPGRIWIQTRTIKGLANALAPMLPRHRS